MQFWCAATIRTRSGSTQPVLAKNRPLKLVQMSQVDFTEITLSRSYVTHAYYDLTIFWLFSVSICIAAAVIKKRNTSAVFEIDLSLLAQICINTLADRYQFYWV